MRARMCRVALLLLLAATLVLGVGVSAAFAEATGVIQGHLLDSASGLPITDQACILHIWHLPDYSGYQYVAAGADGSFEFTGLAAGSYRVWVSDTGSTQHHLAYNELDTEPPFATLAEDDSSVTADVHMRPYSHITGHVSAKSDGHALAGINVSALPWANGHQAGSGTSAVTDSAGNYDLAYVTPAKWHLMFSGGGYEPQTWPNTIEKSPYSGYDYGHSQDVTITTDGDTAAGIDTTLTHFSRIHLHTVDVSGTPQNTYTWSYYLDPGYGWQGNHSQYTYGDSYLEDCYVGGQYKIQNQNGPGPWMHSFYPATVLWSEAETVTIADENTTYEVTQTIFPVSHASGRVTAAQTGAGVPGAVVIVQMLDAGEWVNPAAEAAQAGTQADEAGNWTVWLGPGIYRLRFVADPALQLEPSYLRALGEPTATVIAVATDRVGLDQALMPLDSLAPTTTPTFSGAWSQEATISLTATDGAWGSGVESTWYGIGSQVATQAYTPGQVIHVSTEGTTNVYFGSVDHAGHHEAVRTATVRVDHTSPRAVASVRQFPGYALFSIAASDAVSQVQRISYHYTGSPDTTYTVPLRLKPGGYKIGYRATDLAGNPSESELASFTVPFVSPKLTAPTVSPSKPTHGKSFTISGKITAAETTKRTIVLTIQRKAGKFKTYATVKATLLAGKTSYSVKTKLGKSGSFQIRAYHAADTIHLAGYSKWKAFSVK
jgi:hypothetical protein